MVSTIFASRTETVEPLYWYKSTLGSLEHFVHIDGAQAPVALALIDQAKRDHWFESNTDHTSEVLDL